MSPLIIWIIAIVVIAAILLWYVASKKKEGKGSSQSTSIPSAEPENYQNKEENPNRPQE